MSRIDERARASARAFAAAGRNPDVRRLQLAFAISAMGQWAASVAVTAVSFAAGGAGAVAIQLIARMVPSAIAAPLLATLADRTSRVRVMVGADLVRVVVVGAMAALVAVDAPLGLVYVCSALSGIAGTAFEPAKSAILPSLAKQPDELTAANVVSSSIDSVSLFAGPALGGLLMVLVGAPGVLVATAAGFAVSALLVARIRGAETPRPAADGETAEPFRHAVAEGLRAVAGHPRVRLVVSLMAVQTLVDGLSFALIAAIAIDLLDLGDGGLGLLMAAMGVGGVVGAGVATGLVGSRRLSRAFAIGCLLWGLPFALVGVAPEVVVAVLALGLVGLGNTIVDVSGYTLLQRTAPEPVLARVFGVLESLILGGIALGAALSPLFVAVLGVEGALVAVGLILPLAVALSWTALRKLDEMPATEAAALSSVSMLGALPAPVLEALARGAERVRLAAGEAAVVQGEPGDSFYLVLSGELEVLVDERAVRRHGPGDGFGEIALLRDVPRTATVRAVEPAELLALRRDEFVAAVTGHAPAREAAEETIAARLAWARPALAV